MAAVIWTQEAIDRLREIHAYISRDNTTAADSVIDAIFLKANLLASHPRIGQRYELIVDREVREVVYGHYRIPYLIVDETRIEILGVFHGAMDIDRYLR